MVNASDKIDSEALKRAGRIISEGGLVVFPTETVYGLGGDATNPVSAKKIYAAKGRPSDNPLIIHIADPKDAEEYAYTSEEYYKLADAFMPGPLTVILKAKPTVPKETRGGLDTVAVRCPSNRVARALINYAGVPIAAPSANISGTPSATSVQHVINDMSGRVDMIIDGGNSEIGLESTIVSIDKDTLTLLRPGKITVDELAAVCKQVKIAPAVLQALKEGELALSPGMKYKHYAPRAKMILVDGDFSGLVSYLGDIDCGKIAVVCYDEYADELKDKLKNADIYKFGKASDKQTQANRLFSILRDTDSQDYDCIYAPMPDTSGIGLALYNRMIRASAHKIIKL